MSLFDSAEESNFAAAKPLAARMRPQTLDEFVGQDHIMGEGQLLRRLVAADRLGSLLFFGPPGTGKTTLARLLAKVTGRQFYQLNAVLHGVKDLRETLQKARDELATGGQASLLFIDEIHRFNRAQQDAMLADVENGVVSLIGATTSNPFFAVNNSLISRSQIFQFEPLTAAQIKTVIQHTLTDEVRGLGRQNVALTEEAWTFLTEVCDGDARKAISILETAVIASGLGIAPVTLDKQQIVEAMGQRAVQYDATGAEHYDCASALIKSIRGSDVDAGLYWLARMLEGGEDVRFLCRRLVILASEDVGNADPHALPLAVACSQACEQIGLPECQLTLSQTVAYLACAPKSNAATTAISMARQDVRERRVLPVPKALRCSHYDAAGQLGSGVGYENSHRSPDGVNAQDYLGVDQQYYFPVDRGFEAELKKRLEKIRAILRAADDGSPTD